MILVFFLMYIMICMILWSSNWKFEDQWIIKPWSHGFDPRNCMISWSWSHGIRDLKFLDHGFSWSRGHDPGFSMIFTFWGFSQWSLNSDLLLTIYERSLKNFADKKILHSLHFTHSLHYEKMPITYAEFEPKNPILKKKRRLPARNLNQKHPLFEIWSWIFFRQKKFFA